MSRKRSQQNFACQFCGESFPSMGLSSHEQAHRRALAKAEKVARRFHEVYERLAPKFGYETRAETRKFDPESPNGKLMIAVCAELQRRIP